MFFKTFPICYLILVDQTHSFFSITESKISFSVTKLKFLIIAVAINRDMTVKGVANKIQFKTSLPWPFSQYKPLDFNPFLKSHQPLLSHHTFKSELCDPWVSRLKFFLEDGQNLSQPKLTWNHFQIYLNPLFFNGIKEYFICLAS